MDEIINPAEVASQETLQKIIVAINDAQNFLVEAGAGAGKTYSLIKALKYCIAKKGNTFLKGNKQIACITYTEVARDEIRNRIDHHPAVLADTIHAFSWALIRKFQKPLRALIPKLNDKWKERVEEAGGVGEREIIYNLGYPKITDTEVLLHHDDVIHLISLLLDDNKFRIILTNQFPIIFIDEYQDTAKILADAITKHFLEEQTGPLIGFFGDHWQTIYGTRSCGQISVSAPEKLITIGKNANFRSDKNIVFALNKIRPELPQNEFDPSSVGEITVYHSNNWQGTRLSGNHWKGDLPPEEARSYLNLVRLNLEGRGWVFSYEFTKILMLTNNVLANEQGYSNITQVFDYPDEYLQKKDHYIKFFADVLEPCCIYFMEGKIGEMFKVLNITTPKIHKHSDKVKWNDDMKTLLNVRMNGTIGEVIEVLKATSKPRLSPKIEEYETRFTSLLAISDENKTEDDKAFVDHLQKLKAIPYKEVTALVAYIEDMTPFSTQHGVKGAEFDNVLVVCGRGWNQYNWAQMLEWVNTSVPRDKQDTYERNRNLFYVACSRPKKRLALLFTQELSASAIATLSNWFGVDNLIAI